MTSTELLSLPLPVKDIAGGLLSFMNNTGGKVTFLHIILHKLNC